MRSRRFFTTPQLVQQYKSHILPYLEHATAALYHATDTALRKVDRVQDSFLRAAGLTKEEALLQYRLAPLSTRRDIAMLGLIHRTVLGQGPKHFQRWFRAADTRNTGYNLRSAAKAHNKQLHDFVDETHTELLRRSALGLPRVYNELPAQVVNNKSVKTFQRALQGLVVAALKFGQESWSTLLSPRETHILTQVVRKRRRT